MRILCLMPVFNHRHETTENSVQCFLDQTHSNAYLLIGDDRPAEAQLPKQFGDRWETLQFPDRMPTLMDKYNAMLAYADEEGLQYDAVALFDDDDILLPMHLTAAAYELTRNPECGWYYPQQAFVSYNDDLEIHETGGRFWSCCVIRKSMLDAIGRFPVTGWLACDQECLRKFGEVSQSCHTDKVINYVYRWGQRSDGGTGENHTSGYGTGYADTAWYGKTPYSQAEGELVPEYDEGTLRVLDELEIRFKDIAGILVKE
jgi:hypothetical protein